MSERRLRMQIAGISCADCKVYVSSALKRVGAIEVVVDFRRGFAEFTVPDGVPEEALRAAVQSARYRPGRIEEVRATDETPPDALRRPASLSAIDALATVGSGGGAFAAAIRARAR